MQEEIKIRPISVNTCWQGRRYRTPAYDDFIKEALFLMPRRKMIIGNVEVELVKRIYETME